MLVLWDIDHTLIDTRGVGRELSAAAFEEATGVPMREQATIDGITERVIFRETAKLHGFAVGPEDFARFAAAIGRQHLARAADLRERGHALAGAAAVIDALAARGAVQTVVTGNVRGAAEVKLGVFGLDRHILWDLGAFGEDADERVDLVRFALRRAGRTAAEAVLVGDTPADVAGGLGAGVRVVGVATGRSSAHELRRAGAAAVLPDMRDTSAAVQALLGAE
ncbi:HAD family hydrolase [Streptomyces sp. NRRL F-5630]|uniref:HAD family hydrolase n=1 Tax=Streptomyces sp. NRRL F-5630 TaxID=1463864 RepID=UPI003D7131D4